MPQHTLSSLLSDASRVAAAFTAILPGCSHDPPPAKHSAPLRDRPKKITEKRPDLYDTWLASRRGAKSGPEYLLPGSHRPLTLDNFLLAYDLSNCCAPHIISHLWNIHPYRIPLMIVLDLVRGVFPVFRGYSQALMVDEVNFSAVLCHICSFLSSSRKLSCPAASL